MTQSKVGDVRDYLGIRFTATEELKTFDGKPRGVRWRAGNIAFAIDEAWQDSTGHRFCSNNVHCQTFEKAASRSLKGMAAKYRRARELVDLYEAPDLAEQRAIVDRMN